MSNPLRVLIVDDSGDDVLLVLRELRRAGYDTSYTWAQTMDDLTAALAAQDWDVIISDYRMPRFNGLDALKLVQARGRDVPFIIISGAIGEETAVAAMKAGAHDYVMKNHLVRLVPAVTRELREAEVRRQRTHAMTALRASEELANNRLTELQAIYATAPAGLCVLDANLRFLSINDQLAALNGHPAAAHLGHTIREMVPALASSAEPLMRQVLKTGVPIVNMEISGTTDARPGVTQWWLENFHPLKNTAGQIIGLNVVVVDITERKQIEEELRQAHLELEQRVQARTAELQTSNALLQRALRGWRALSECTAAMLRATSETELLEQVCQIVVKIGGYRMAWVGIAEQTQARRVRPVAHAGFTKRFLDTAQITWAEKTRGRCPTGTAIRTGQPAVCQDLLHDPLTAPWREQAHTHGYASAVALPLLGPNHCLGALTVYAAEPAAFDNEAVSLLTELAGNLTYGILALRAQADRRRLEEQVLAISEHEQRRIGQDLHDGLGQEIAAIGLMTNVLRKNLVKANRPEAAAAEQLIGLIDEAGQKVRELARGLHPVKPDPHGLMSGLKGLAAQVAQHFKVDCRFECPQPVLIADTQVATHLYRIAQEAARNAVVHGQPQRIDISLRATDNVVELLVKNDGKALSKSPTKERGLGLEIMKYRATAIGALLTIDSAPDTGTTVTCSLKLPGPPPKDSSHAH